MYQYKYYVFWMEAFWSTFKRILIIILYPPKRNFKRAQQMIKKSSKVKWLMSMLEVLKQFNLTCVFPVGEWYFNECCNVTPLLCVVVVLDKLSLYIFLASLCKSTWHQNLHAAITNELLMNINFEILLHNAEFLVCTYWHWMPI